MNGLSSTKYIHTDIFMKIYIYTDISINIYTCRYSYGYKGHEHMRMRSYLHMHAWTQTLAHHYLNLIFNHQVKLMNILSLC